MEYLGVPPRLLLDCKKNLVLAYLARLQFRCIYAEPPQQRCTALSCPCVTMAMYTASFSGHFFDNVTRGRNNVPTLYLSCPVPAN